jgi:hypothetical protein
MVADLSLVKSRVNERVAVTRDIIICRPDLPENPEWLSEGLPYKYCWRISKLFEEAEKSGRDTPLWSEARRVWWEAYWRLLGRYKGEKSFFETYEVVDTTVKPYAGSPEFVLRNIVLEGLKLIPPEVREYTFKPYRAVLRGE